jgi:D-alanine-D-alanine ligase
VYVESAPCDVPVLLLYDLDPSWSSREKEEVVSLSSQLGDAISAFGHPTIPVELPDTDLSNLLSPYDPLSHIVFNWCESIPGIPHSEALVARTLETLGFAFTGASSASLALTQDKRQVKELLEQWNIPTPGWRLYDRPEVNGWKRFPAIVKAVNEHCSEGITPESVVMTKRELIDRIAYVLEEYRQPALVEDFIDGREFHVSLWGNGHIEMLPPAEMDFSVFSEVQDRLCTYDSKFVPGSVHYDGIQTLLPAPLNEDELQALERTCKAAYTVSGCRDYARIDLRIRDGVFHVLDVNPNADISMDASLACAAELAGYSYGETGSRIVRLAARRHPVLGGKG